MKKKSKTRLKKRQPKIDVVLASLLNLEYQVKELIKRIDQLQNNNTDKRSPSWLTY